MSKNLIWHFFLMEPNYAFDCRYFMKLKNNQHGLGFLLECAEGKGCMYLRMSSNMRTEARAGSL